MPQFQKSFWMAFFASLVVQGALYAQTIPPATRQDAGFVGRLAKVELVHWLKNSKNGRFDRRGGPVVEITWDRRGRWMGQLERPSAQAGPSAWQEPYFDQAGRLSAVVHGEALGEPAVQLLERLPGGRLEADEFWPAEHTSLFRRTSWVYNQAGTVTGAFVRFASGTEDYRLSFKPGTLGRIKEEVRLNAAGKPVKRVVRSWDKRGRLVSEIVWDAKRPVQRRDYTYNRQGNPAEVLEFSLTGKKPRQTDRITYHYTWY